MRALFEDMFHTHLSMLYSKSLLTQCLEECQVSHWWLPVFCPRNFLQARLSTKPNPPMVDHQLSTFYFSEILLIVDTHIFIQWNCCPFSKTTLAVVLSCFHFNDSQKLEVLSNVQASNASETGYSFVGSPIFIRFNTGFVPSSL